MIPLRKRFTAGLTALCLGLGTHLMAQPRAAADPADCTPANTVSMFTYNDFHGRLANAAALFTPVEKARASRGGRECRSHQQRGRHRGFHVRVHGR